MLPGWHRLTLWLQPLQSSHVRLQVFARKAEKGARSEAFEGAASVNSLEETLKEKTLSDLQATAARLGFNPGYDRGRLITAIIQEYRRQA